MGGAIPCQGGVCAERKRVYVHAVDKLTFWEGTSLTWSRNWNLSRIRHFVIGGDGAGWLRQGVEHFPNSVWQLDGFHLARACRRALGKAQGQCLFQAIREGRWEEAEHLWQTRPKGTQARARQAQRWLSTLLEQHLMWTPMMPAPWAPWRGTTPTSSPTE
ncbi:MAG TPA: hypothetical protein ENK34_03105 [Rhodobacteraceae bacterium]|nr:hypothetical protein [Paracoccaceae bacterium]